MAKTKLRLYFNILVLIIFIVYLSLVIFTNIPDVKWSIGFLILTMSIYIVRDIKAPKQKRSDDNGNN
ncbi:hypothetical protein [Staphylococcus equorum]|uniref:hypothetical protein n=1 Tax=Staphylococcus equorum TaxID=246432 RepID=UPI0008536813|nr:hypothetical protein [Staphylococcus equorum]OEK76302.1 hypothetical protein AST05_08095 [Staphylococcus equorum]